MPSRNYSLQQHWGVSQTATLCEVVTVHHAKEKLMKTTTPNALDRIADVLEHFQTRYGDLEGFPISLNTYGNSMDEIYEGFVQCFEEQTEANNRIADAILELAKAVRESKGSG